MTFLLAAMGPLFAETVISGEFAYGFNSSDEVYENVFDTGDLIFTGISEGGNASITFGLDFASVDYSDMYVSTDFFSDIYMTMDITGALDVDSPVGVSLLAGRTSYSAGNFLGDITGYNTYDIINAETTTTGYIGLSLNVLDSVNIEYALDPNLVDGVQNMYGNINGVFGPVAAEVFFTALDEALVGGDIYSSVGGDFVATLEVVSFGAGLEYNIDDEEFRYGASARTPILPKTDMGISFMGYSDADINPYGLSFDANYAITDAIKIYGAFIMKDLEDVNEDTLGYEVSASYTFDSDMTAYVGYAAAESGFNALGDLTDDSFFVAVSAAF